MLETNQQIQKIWCFTRDFIGKFILTVEESAIFCSSFHGVFQFSLVCPCDKVKCCECGCASVTFVEISRGWPSPIPSMGHILGYIHLDEWLIFMGSTWVNIPYIGWYGPGSSSVNDIMGIFHQFSLLGMFCATNNISHEKLRWRFPPTSCILVFFK